MSNPRRLLPALITGGTGKRRHSAETPGIRKRWITRAFGPGLFRPVPGGPPLEGALRGNHSTLERWANSIGSTAAHEAGHNYGLSHADGDDHARLERTLLLIT